MYINCIFIYFLFIFFFIFFKDYNLDDFLNLQTDSMYSNFWIIFYYLIIFALPISKMISLKAVLKIKV